ncbi:cyclin-dependent kinase 10, isoform CRA_g [Ascobolus immersus RN42]|uniref:cyclin-dependent kinase n=1 Tax=Ascobolus immersus RN42 TaxID=1160509 RepID=A0A3N4IFJ6_ASCIM|nr:cyclin-dependent kinase 10, isoform CRA_g [Ascobolus immersus RN42]
MSDSEESSERKWMSITGEELPGLDHTHGFLGNCRDINEYEQLNALGEGTYGVVTRARDKQTSEIVALKQVRIFDESRPNGIPITALREISLLKSLRHENIVSVLNVAVGSDLNDVYMVMEYVEQDLAHLIDNVKVIFSESEVKCLIKQLLKGVDHLHRNDIIHRDIKASNLLLNGRGILKLADFGMAREFSHRPLTPGVVTVWYRSPELLLNCVRYTPTVDIWSCGLILGELLLRHPLLPGDDEFDELDLITKLIGPATDRVWPKRRLLPGLSGYNFPTASSAPQGVDGLGGNLERLFRDYSENTIALLRACLSWDPERRPSAREALKHGYFTEEPRAKDPKFMPTFPEYRNDGKSHKRGRPDAAKDDGFVFEFEDHLPRGSHKKRRN